MCVVQVTAYLQCPPSHATSSASTIHEKAIYCARQEIKEVVVAGHCPWCCEKVGEEMSSLTTANLSSPKPKPLLKLDLRLETLERGGEPRTPHSLVDSGIDSEDFEDSDDSDDDSDDWEDLDDPDDWDDKEIEMVGSTECEELSLPASTTIMQDMSSATNLKNAHGSEPGEVRLSARWLRCIRTNVNSGMDYFPFFCAYEAETREEIGEATVIYKMKAAGRAQRMRQVAPHVEDLERRIATCESLLDNQDPEIAVRARDQRIQCQITKDEFEMWVLTSKRRVAFMDRYGWRTLHTLDQYNLG